ncbi:MAG: pyrroline-5-carboxylate reductase [Gammaproteobacteria bacterium]
MKDTRIGFIGGGNMGRALIGGLIADGMPASRILVADADPAATAALTARHGVTTGANREVAAAADILVLAVKPQVMRAVALDLAGAPRAPGQVVLSIAAGIRSADLARWLWPGTPIVRAMPNTPALVGSGASALFAGAGVDEAQRALAENVLRAVGVVEWVADEALMDAATAISGSGPAYFFLLMEALEHAATRLGLSPASARMLSIQTAFGAAKMALESSTDAATLRRQVTSPGGTTQAALETFAMRDFLGTVDAAVDAARARSAELAAQFGRD